MCRRLTLALVILMCLASCESAPSPSPSPTLINTSAPTPSTMPTPTTTALTSTMPPTRSTPLANSTEFARTLSPTLPLYPLPLYPPTPTPTPTPRVYNRADRVLFFRDHALWTTDLDGGDLTRLTPPDFLGSHPFEGDFRPRVSPDGRYIVTLTDGRGEWLLSSDGRQPPRYLERFAYPSWSPDSGALTYTKSGSVYVRRLSDWDQLRVIARLDSRGVAYAEWSPDGNWIAFLAFEQATAVPSGAKRQLWLVHPDGSQLHMLESVDALAREPGPREVWWGDSGQIVLAADSQPWILVPSPEHQFTYPFALPYEPPRIYSLSPTKPFAAGVSGFSTFGIKFNAQANGWPMVTELRQCERFRFRAWSPDGARLLCTPDSMSRMSVEIFDGQRDFANWGHVFDLPGPSSIFFAPNGDELVFETRLEDENEPVIWRAALDPLTKAKRIGTGMLFDVFRIK